MWGHLLGMTLCNCLDVSGLQVGDQAARTAPDSQAWDRASGGSHCGYGQALSSSVQKGISSDKCYF